MKLITKETFSDEVLELMTHSTSEYMDAIITVAERNGIEIEAVSGLLTEKLTTFLEMEAKSLNLLINSKDDEETVFY